MSSVAAESSFFGTTSFHFDNLNLQNENDFCKNNLNKIVFNEVQNLERAIEEQILNKKMTLEENKLLHGKLDPFQDGKVGLRTALIIDLIFKKHDKLNNLGSLFQEVNKLINNNKILLKKNISMNNIKKIFLLGGSISLLEAAILLKKGKFQFLFLLQKAIER